ncbi:MAG: DUF4087 domain-containing protein [Rhodanobacter sp.]
MSVPSIRSTAGIAVLLWLVAAPALAADQAGAGQPERRCGWFENPTPGNATLTDRDGEWEIATQGGHQADGDWPGFADAQWVATNGHHGYGCACLSMRVDPAARIVVSISKAAARPLAACRHDKSLHEPAHDGE